MYSALRFPSSPAGGSTTTIIPTTTTTRTSSRNISPTMSSAISQAAKFCSTSTAKTASLNFFSSSPQHSPSSSPTTTRTPLHVTNTTWSSSTAAMWNHVRVSLHWNVDTGRFHSYNNKDASNNAYIDTRTDKISTAPEYVNSTATITATTTTTTSRSSSTINDEDLILEQRHAQNKNKLLMLLQLEQVLADREARQAQKQALKEEFFVALVRRQIQRATLPPKPITTQPLMRTWRLNSTLLDLQEYYRKFDACIQELEDRNEILELEGFKQLVIRELQEHAEAKEQHRKHLQVVHGQLMQRFLMEEWRIREGWSNSHHDWIAISNEDSILANSTRLVEQDEDMDGSEWVLCDYYN